MKNSKRILKITAFVLAAVIPFVFVLTVSAFAGDMYSETYYAALLKQYDRLDKVDGERVILLGNSNVSFGADSKLFEELYHKPLVSFGLYGSLGTKLMLDLSKSGLKKGDTVVIALEYNTGSYSLDFNAEAVLKAFETRPELLLKTDRKRYEDVFCGFFSFAASKYSYALKGDKPVNDGVYKNSSVNVYGEIEKGLRPGNIMREGCLDEKIAVAPDMIGEGFIDYLNAYIDYCHRRGITVLYSFSPVNKKAVEEQGITDEDFYGLYDYLDGVLDCPIISNPNAYVFDYGYFYDTNFHLNDDGVVLRTVNLVRDLNLYDGVNPHITTEIPSPPPPLVPTVSIDKTIDYTDSSLFVYKETSSGYLAITGTTPTAETLRDIVIPVIHDGKYVTKITSYALENLKGLRSVTIPVGISELSSFAFYGCGSLEKIILLEDCCCDISVYSDTFSGVNKSCRIVLKNADKSSFATGYFWSQVKLEIVEE